MSEPTENDQAETDDWAAAMAEQAAVSQNDSAEKEAEVDDWAAAMAEQATSPSQSDNATSHAAEKNNNTIIGSQASTASVFQELSKDGVANNTRHDIDMILDIPVQMTVELGRTKIAIKNLLQLAQGSVVELDGMAGEPMDVLVNGCLIAQGEVVVVNDKFGIRLTDIITPSERIRKLNR
ncbi:MAG: flagellar motor switch protein FliN [Nitrosomonas sp.]|jgi:flagellar motor switch protein FliN/FliY|uniref:flagellar motor switch protein FliN n=1 Tax=Nitrosomonas sp. TaxID=42353 RepID=UPI00272706F7|nr:flagellar motor switch protein FliN [Nitrosomonas sp.]MBK6958254.1 flagellar motor switch protein FliN [Nitrosomonas sp.]MDO8894322.1 flagellar motor switch protein FliN [Nitrosomonas sp.]MDO9469324.1 flagellar motor switch protein FliN [Nitrosomonas sp.]MDP1550419.1 flagellar motor switch protein FliN [Nitrosomonas sp.]MDP1785759.1 flagellar motor switch protein FliN [Nitrosomonas sp.]